MACNLPVVAARATGSESLVTDGVTGRLIRPGAISEFADALQSYLEDEGLRAVQGAAGKAVADRYRWDSVNQAMLDTYLRIVAQRERGARAPQSSPVP
jgi:glycosyltransferase involved in cell wall biosynthesis